MVEGGGGLKVRFISSAWNVFFFLPRTLRPTEVIQTQTPPHPRPPFRQLAESAAVRFSWVKGDRKGRGRSFRAFLSDFGVLFSWMMYFISFYVTCKAYFSSDRLTRNSQIWVCVWVCVFLYFATMFHQLSSSCISVIPTANPRRLMSTKWTSASGRFSFSPPNALHMYSFSRVNSTCYKATRVFFSLSV